MWAKGYLFDRIFYRTYNYNKVSRRKSKPSNKKLVSNALVTATDDTQPLVLRAQLGNILQPERRGFGLTSAKCPMDPHLRHNTHHQKTCSPPFGCDVWAHAFDSTRSYENGSREPLILHSSWSQKERNADGPRLTCSMLFVIKTSSWIRNFLEEKKIQFQLSVKRKFGRGW